MATTSQEYTLERKTGANTSEEIKFPASSVDGLSTVATSGSYNDLSNKPTIPDVSGKANLNGGNTFTGKQTLNSPASDGYSINAAGYVKGSWLQASAISNKGSNTGKVCVFDNSGWIYYRTPAEILTEAGGAKASDIPTNYVTTNTAQDITAEKKFLSTLIVGAKDDGSTGFKVIQGDIAGGDTLFTVSINGIDLDADALNIPLLISGSAGIKGQVLTSQGSSNAPIWGDITKHGYTQLTNENLNTITEAGWYRAGNGNTCTNRPNIGSYQFILVVEKATTSHVRQTIYKDVDMSYSYTRYSLNGGSTWLSWTGQQTLANDTTQYFSGRKSFSGGINVGASLQFGSDAGSSGQFAMSQGSSSAPKWVNLQVKVNGTTYTADNSGLIDLGTISGGGSSNVIVDRPMIQGVEYTVFDSGEYGSFIGTFSLETQDSSITITVGDADYIITNNDWVHCRITIDKNNDFVYSTIAINTGNVNRTWSFSTLPSSGAVKISTDLTSSYMEHSICVIMKEVI